MDFLVSLIAVPVTDLERSKSFYARALGFRPLSDRTYTMARRSARVIRLQPLGGGPAIMLANWFPSMAPGSLRGLTLETRDIEACHLALHQAGACPSAIMAAPWGRLLTVADPDGNQLAFQQISAERP